MNQGSFMRNFLAVQPRLHAYLQCICGNAQAAEDLFQEVATVLWEKYPEYDESRPFLPWALGVARYQTLYWKKRHARNKLVFSEEIMELLAETAAELPVAEPAEAGRLRQCLEKLPPASRQLIEWRYVDQENIGELAARLGKSLGSLHMLLKRTREKLRECMARGGTEPAAIGPLN